MIVIAVLIVVALTAQTSAQVKMEHVRKFVDSLEYRVLTFQEQLVYNSLYPKDAERVLPISVTACEKPEGNPADMLLIRTYMQIEDSVLYAFVPYTGSGYESACTLDGSPLVFSGAPIAPNSYSAVRVNERLKAYSDTLVTYQNLDRRISKDRSVEGTVVGAVIFGVGLMNLLDKDTGDEGDIGDVLAGVATLGGGYLTYRSIKGVIAAKKDRLERTRLEVKLTMGF